MRVLYDEHAAALWRYAVRLTGDQARAEDVVQETLLRAWQHPEVTADAERSARAWLFTVARNLIIDEKRSARSRNESATPDLERVGDRAGPDEVDIRTGPPPTGRGPQPVVRGTSRGPETGVLPRLDYRADRSRPPDRGGHGEIPAALRRTRIKTHSAGEGGGTVTQFGVPRGGELLDDDRYETWDAAYILGSLSSNERLEYEAHLATCARCRAAVAELSGIPALLARVDPADVQALDETQPEPPPLNPEVLDSLLAKVAWRRRRTRLVSSIALAAAAAVLAVAAGDRSETRRVRAGFGDAAGHRHDAGNEQGGANAY